MKNALLKLASARSRMYRKFRHFGDDNGRRGPTENLAHKRPHTIAGAFFVPAMTLYGGGRAWDTFGCAGFQVSRSANPRTAATSHRVAAIRGSSSIKLGAPLMHTRNPSKARAAAHRAMALASLRSNSSLAVRLNRYNHHRALERALEAQPQGDAIDWLESLDGDAWADACEEIAAALKAKEVSHA